MLTKLFHNAWIYTPFDQGVPAVGEHLNTLTRIDSGALWVVDGRIRAIGTKKSVRTQMTDPNVAMEIDCNGHLLLPGFVDPHTHMCFATPRENEFELRMTGVPYLTILERGGGILSSVAAVDQTDESRLYEMTRAHALAALKSGTTTLEIKSGYGLTLANELKMLRVIDRVARTTPLDIVPTFLGAHAIPRPFTHQPSTYVDVVIKEMLPEVKKQGIARYCDVFCEKGVFTLEQSRQILLAARHHGLGLKIHADEVHDLGASGLAAELRAASADHLLVTPDLHLKKMAEAGVLAVLLPGTAYSLRHPYARAREMINAGLAIALATDCNPGSSYTESMPFILGLAVINMHLTPNEALTAATLNAAYAIDMAKDTGSLDIGKFADFILLEGASPAILAYHGGIPPILAVYKKGESVSA